MAVDEAEPTAGDDFATDDALEAGDRLSSTVGDDFEAGGRLSSTVGDDFEAGGRLSSTVGDDFGADDAPGAGYRSWSSPVASPGDVDDEFVTGPFVELSASTRRKRLLILLAFLAAAGIGALIFAVLAADGIGNVIQSNEQNEKEEELREAFVRLNAREYSVEMKSCDLGADGVLRAKGTVKVDPSLDDGVYRVELVASVSLAGDIIELRMTDKWNSVDAALTDWTITEAVVADYKPGDFELTLASCNVTDVSRKVRQN